MAQQKQSGSGVLSELLERGRLVWRLMNDERVPSWLKLGIPVVVLLYFISPIDLIPDFLLGLGQLDDLGVVLLGMEEDEDGSYDFDGDDNDLDAEDGDEEAEYDENEEEEEEEV